MNKFNKWHQEQLFWFMEKLNLGVYEVAWISWIKGFIMGALLLLLCSCGVQFKYGTAVAYSDGIYNNDVVLEVPNNVKIDTLNIFQFQRKLRTDFNFRWDFAQYAMNQPYSWYWNNPRLDGIWRPYNRFDVYLHSHWFWSDWAFNYPYNYWGWNNWYSWNRPYYYYGWNRPYYSWYNYNYNVVWNASRRNNNVAYINGRRGVNNTIENTISNNRRVRTYPNNVNNNINNLVNNFTRENNNIRINNNSNIQINNNSNNNNIRIPNNSNNIKPNYNSRPIHNYSRPTYNSRTIINNTSRSSNINISRGNSKGKN